ncbi:hypothetical protein [Pseudosporangium ferrugineum]|uniref:hypothetical protein n=1 Tax=Pseudosporangium ferrugineum TaxID=439699 RepID=UPI000D05256E|nr:hypothetical protein [Pseudosporangium ferrugineum]
MEDALTLVEGPASAVFDKILSPFHGPSSLSAEDLATLASFLAFHTMVDYFFGDDRGISAVIRALADAFTRHNRSTDGLVSRQPQGAGGVGSRLRGIETGGSQYPWAETTSVRVGLEYILLPWHRDLAGITH